MVLQIIWCDCKCKYSCKARITTKRSPSSISPRNRDCVQDKWMSTLVSCSFWYLWICHICFVELEKCFARLKFVLCCTLATQVPSEIPLTNEYSVTNIVFSNITHFLPYFHKCTYGAFHNMHGYGQCQISWLIWKR